MSRQWRGYKGDLKAWKHLILCACGREQREVNGEEKVGSCPHLQTPVLVSWKHICFKHLVLVSAWWATEEHIRCILNVMRVEIYAMSLQTYKWPFKLTKVRRKLCWNLSTYKCSIELLTGRRILKFYGTVHLLGPTMGDPWPKSHNNCPN